MSSYIAVNFPFGTKAQTAILLAKMRSKASSNEEERDGYLINIMTIKAPFPYFGGKSAVAEIVWESIGNVAHYIEPFAGSLAVLLARSNFDSKLHAETVNDKDGFIANVWRSLQFSPDETAKWCDWPVNHADLSARKKTLIKNESRLLENLVNDDKWHDPVIAGYWIWAASCWIGTGLLSLNQSNQRTTIGQIPHIGNGGMGIHASGQIPHIINGGKDVHAIGHRQNNDQANTEKGVQEPYNINIYKWFRELSERLRYVRVVCGDWTRVCGGNWQDNCGDVGIFFDPPYGISDRTKDIYHHDSTEIAKDVLAWCIERGKLSSYRIVLAGYDEYEILKVHGWTKKSWVAQGGYANVGTGKGKENRKRETLWMSPYCLRTELF